jgi:NAD+ kinase
MVDRRCRILTNEGKRHFARVGVLAHPTRPETFYLARQVAQWLCEHAVEADVLHEWDQDLVGEHAAGWDLVVSVGGDGTMLRAARGTADMGVPLVGINMGRLGFLAELAPDRWSEGLETIWRGEYWVEQRMMLEVSQWSGNRCCCRDEALNEMVIGRGAMPRLIEAETYVDGAWTTTYRADALIVATPTGSTAYALAVGGPILPPELRNLVVAPVAAHLSLDRALVLSGDSTVEVVVHCSDPATLTVDGKLLGEVTDGDLIEVCAAKHVSRFIRTGERTYFYRSLLDRLEPKHSTGPGDRK